MKHSETRPGHGFLGTKTAWRKSSGWLKHGFQMSSFLKVMRSENAECSAERVLAALLIHTLLCGERMIGDGYKRRLPNLHPDHHAH